MRKQGKTRRITKSNGFLFRRSSLFERKREIKERTKDGRKRLRKAVYVWQNTRFESVNHCENDVFISFLEFLNVKIDPNKELGRRKCFEEEKVSLAWLRFFCAFTKSSLDCNRRRWKLLMTKKRCCAARLPITSAKIQTNCPLYLFSFIFFMKYWEWREETKTAKIRVEPQKRTE